jgi:hypothetical protein
MTSLQIEYVGYMCKIHHHTFLLQPCDKFNYMYLKTIPFLSIDQNTQMENMKVFTLLKSYDTFENITSWSTTIAIGLLYGDKLNALKMVAISKWSLLMY